MHHVNPPPQAASNHTMALIAGNEPLRAAGSMALIQAALSPPLSDDDISAIMIGFPVAARPL